MHLWILKFAFKLMRNILISIIVLFCVLLAGLAFGWYIFSGKKTEITATTLLTELKSQGFLITESYVFNEPVKIENKSGNMLKDFFWSQEVFGQGIVQVNSGVNLALLEEKDIEIKGEKITITLPNIEVFNSSLVGELIVQNNQGILKRIFDNEDAYNSVYEQLIKNAENAAKDPKLVFVAQDNAKNELKKLLSFIVKDKEIDVQFK